MWVFWGRYYSAYHVKVQKWETRKKKKSKVSWKEIEISNEDDCRNPI